MAGGLKALRAAKIWVVLIIIAMIYSIRQKMGVPASQDLFGDLDKLGQNWLGYAYWAFGIALFLLIVSKLSSSREDEEEENSSKVAPGKTGDKKIEENKLEPAPPRSGRRN